MAVFDSDSMRNKGFSFALWIILWLMVGFAAGRAQVVWPDSLLTVDHVYELIFTDPDMAQNIVMEMREREIEPETELDIVEGDILYNNDYFNKALVFYHKALDDDSLQDNPDEYLGVIHRLISCYDGLHDEVATAKYTQLLMKEARKHGCKHMESVALFQMGKMAYYQGKEQSGYRLIEEAISLMKQSDYAYKYDNLRYEYNTLFIMYQRDSLYENALETLDELEQVLSLQTGEEPEIAGLMGKEMKTLYAHRTNLLWQMMRYREAEETYRQWRKIAPFYTKDDYLIAPYLSKSGRIKEAIRIYKAKEESLRANNDTINYHMRGLKRSLAYIYLKMGDYRTAARYFEDLSMLTDSLKVREQNSHALELAALYETHKYEMEAEEQANKAKMRTIALLCALFVILLFLILIVSLLLNKRQVNRKNQHMADIIQKLLHYKDDLESMKSSQKESTDRAKTAQEADMAMEESSVAKSEEAGDDMEKKRDQVLFDKLDRMVNERKLYLNPMFSRSDMMELIHVDKNRLAKIMQHQGKPNVVAYVNEKRLEYAVKLMGKRSPYKISAIAEMCGIPNVPTFNRLFKQEYGMTPSEFKKSVAESND